MTYRGTVKGNVVVLEPGASLPDGTPVQVETDSAPVDHIDERQDMLFRMTEFAADMGTSDLATNADHYLYGHPKADHAG